MNDGINNDTTRSDETGPDDLALLDDASRSYLSAFREEGTSSPALKAANLAAIRRRTRDAEPSVGEDGEQPRMRWAAAVFVVKMSALSLALGTAGVGAVAAVARVVAPANAPQESAAKEPSRGPTAPELPGPTASAPPIASTSRPGDAQPPGGVSRTPSGTPAGDSTSPRRVLPKPAPTEPVVATPTDALAQELRLLKDARAQMDQQRPAAAMALLEEHARRFPAGALTQEREAWRAIASCRSAADGAGSRARAFVSTYPASPLVAKVRAACQLPQKP